VIRRYIVPALLALSLPALPSHAQTASSALAPEETLLQVAATGIARSPADKITLTVSVDGRGETTAAAREAAQSKLQRLRDALAEKGIDRAATTVSPISVPRFSLNSPPVVTVGGNPGPTRTKPTSASANVQIVVSSIAEKDTVLAVLESQDLTSFRSPQIELRDNSKARVIAAADAIAKAKADADVYASSVGLRLGRILKVSNHGDISIDGLDFEALSRNSRMTGDVDSGEVETRVRVWIDFAMVAR
jgi:uncharacterized protein YggE